MKPEEGDASTVTTVSPPRSPDGAVVWVLSSRAKGTSVRLPGEIGGVITIGKVSGNDLVLDEQSVSRRHLQIRRTEQGLEIEDLASTNGTTIGGARVRSAIVEPGTIIHAGDVELLIGVELGNVVIPPSD